MSANNIVVIIKGKDGKFRGYHRDMDMYCNGYYEDGAPCSCLAGKEEDIPEPDKDCYICNGSGKIDSSNEAPVFEADTIEGAIHAYDKWLERMNDNEDGFPFVVEYGYQFVGLESNEITKENLEKSERGEDLHRVDSVEELMEDFDNDEEKPMNIRDIVKKYLIDNHYDGLAGEGCGCEIGDLMCCNTPELICEPGHIMFCSTCQAADCEFRREGGHCIGRGIRGVK